jgi:hypothetical protein
MPENYEDIVAQYGEPIYKLNVQHTDKELFASQDVPQKYHIFKDANCAGGIIVYGLYPRGWLVNPPLRRLVSHFLNHKP